MRLLDLFCGAGGSAVGYHRAGFDEIVGVDIRDQPRYPFRFVRADAMTYPLDGFDAIHASPPCQAFTAYRNRHKHVKPSPDLIAPTRLRLGLSTTPWVIENVYGAPLNAPFRLCGSTFDLPIRRHRYFESSVFMLAPGCRHEWQRGLRLYPQATNRKNRRNTVEIGTWRIPFSVQQKAMGIDWMKTRGGKIGNFGSELSQAIPPAYTEWIGKRLIEAIRRAAA